MAESKIVNNFPVDFVASQGTSSINNDIWTYRTWSSGKVEAWGQLILASVPIEQRSPIYGGYRVGLGPNHDNGIFIDIPEGIFTSTPKIIIVRASAQGCWVAFARAISATRIEIMFSAGSETTVTNQIINIYAWEDPTQE